ncbi:MAG TPA: zinc-dependent alcohol dehydrogenase family protein, partial [Acetobacteraceae bacterium]|nr:zinc-dependent alcohol dehydrogenase family protein [Acetobacteraceae bacterium]
MRSVRIHEFGGPDVLKIEDVAIPAPAAGEVRLRVRAIGLNRTEVTFRTGRSAARPSLPSQIGFEAAGEIDAVGPNVAGFSRGDRVAVIPAYGAGDYGFYGELSLAPARSLVRVPEGVTWQDAAASWAAFATAWAGLLHLARLSEGQAVLITAASSSVGLAAIQVARSVGAVPIALSRTRAKSEALRANGAAEVIATQDHDAEQDVAAEVMRLTEGRGAAAVFDAVAGPGFAHLVEAAAPGATLVVYGGLGGATAAFPVMPMLGRSLTVRGFGLAAVTRDDANLAALTRFVTDGLARGALRPVIAKIFP